MTRIEARGASDVGRAREVNEDALFLGDSVFAVADGMGGHLAGEVASAIALEPVKQLDGHVYADAAGAVGALRAAVVVANDEVSAQADREPSYAGMGTTLTAAMVEGRRLHFAHVGDSRAYLLRGGHFSQLTDDHTLVQHLVDEGQITREEAESHPQRSMVTRAIGVSRDVDVDSMSLELEPGDQLLLCSDGLTGAVADAQIAETLSAGDDADTTIARLIQHANDAGGPDNITVILLRYGDPAEGMPAPVSDGDRAAERGPAVPISTRDDDGGKDWANSLGRLGSFGTAPGHASSASESPRRPGRWQRIGAAILALLVIAGLGVVGGRWLLSQSYYVGLDGDQVVIYQGVAGDYGPVGLSWVAERTPLTRDDVDEFFAEDLEDGGVAAANLDDARRIVEGAPRGDDEEDDADEDSDADASS